MDNPPPPIFLAGPTAAGKSALALELAGLLGGEIVSVDSMQVYRGMEIGTAKPSAADQRRARHHLIDVADLDQSFDAAQFVRLAAGRAGHSGARKAAHFLRGNGALLQGLPGRLG
jgi:tRNA dimethylallyltransferase